MSESLKERIEKLLGHNIILFMKGSPQEPQCGFSAQVVKILNEYEVPYESFDILKDQELREGLKSWSQWPTYPQLYVGKELVGGCDIVMNLHKNGELKALLSS